MDNYTYTIHCDSYYYGYPEAEKRLTIKSDCLEMKVVRYGNHGYDIPTSNSRRCNGFYWQMHPMMILLFANKGYSITSDIREGETKKITLDGYGNVIKEEKL